MVETLLGTLMLIFPLIFTSNLVVAFVKYLSDYSATRTFLRVVLIVFTVIGLVAGAAISGDPVNFNQLTDLGKLLLETVVTAVGAHYSYKAIKKSY